MPTMPPTVIRPNPEAPNTRISTPIPEEALTGDWFARRQCMEKVR